MAQNDLVVVGIDVAKDKVDACIRALSQRQTFPSTAEGRRKLICWLRKHKVTKAVMEASGGYERELGQGAARERPSKSVSSIRSGCAASPDRPGDWPRTMRSMREMIAWFAETFGEAAEPGPRRGTREAGRRS